MGIIIHISRGHQLGKDQERIRRCKKKKEKQQTVLDLGVCTDYIVSHDRQKKIIR